MTDYLLVHGAVHGGWCWRHVADRLRDRGHRVFTPTLTGVGERLHLTTPETKLDTPVANVVAVVDAEELDDFVLVAHITEACRLPACLTTAPNGFDR